MGWITTVHIIPSLICLGLMPITLCVNKWLYYNVTDEEHFEKGKVIQSIIKTYSLVQCIAWPWIVGSAVLGKVVIGIISPEPAAYVLSIIVLIDVLIVNYVNFHSLLLAICKYTFVILEAQAEAIGIARLRSVFLGSSIAVPAITAATYIITSPLDNIYKQWFYDHDFSSEKTNNSDLWAKNSVNYTIESPMYLLANEFLPASIIHGIKMVDTLLIITIYSNIIEGFIYAHLSIVNKRYIILISWLYIYVHV